MKVIDPGHEYELKTLDVPENTISDPLLIAFVKRTGDNYPGNIEPAHSGTTSQEVMRMLIERAKYVNHQKPHEANELIIKHLRDCIWMLEERAAQQHNRKLPERHTVRYAIEYIETCPQCGHIYCEHAE
jgi:hypothetical protein